MVITNIEDKESALLIHIPDSKTHIQRTFSVIQNSGVPGLNLIDIYRKYISLRPNNAKSKHLFLAYRNGKCVNQIVGINSFSKLPSTVAKYLNLPEPSTYTGHSFRRTSASLLVDSGGDLIQLKKHGGWKSSTVAEGYVDSSMNAKLNCASKILSGKCIGDNSPSYSRAPLISNILNEHSISVTQTNSSEAPTTGSKLNINNPNNCTFNITIMK